MVSREKNRYNYGQSVQSTYRGFTVFNKFVPRLALIVTTVIWGLTFVFIKEALVEVPPSTFLLYRFGLASFGSIIIFNRRIRKPTRSLAIKGISAGTVLFLGYWFQTWGLKFTTATKSGFITGMFVVFVPVLSFLFLRKKVGLLKWISVLLALTGLGLMIVVAGGGMSGVNFGDVLTIFCAVLYAIHIILVGKFSKPDDYITFFVTQILTVTVFSGINSLALGNLTLPRTLPSWTAIGFTGLLATAFAYWAQNRYQPMISDTGAGIIYSAEPFFAALFGYLIAGEQLTGWQMAGGGLILLAILLSQIPPTELLSRVAPEER